MYFGFLDNLRWRVETYPAYQLVGAMNKYLSSLLTEKTIFEICFTSNHFKYETCELLFTDAHLLWVCSRGHGTTT
jgi:hypothetical protein